MEIFQTLSTCRDGRRVARRKRVTIMTIFRVFAKKSTMRQIPWKAPIYDLLATRLIVHYSFSKSRTTRFVEFRQNN